MRRRSVLAAGAAALLTVSRGHAQGVPWFGFGPVDTAYAMSIDTTVAFTGRWSLLLVSLPGATRATWIASQQIVDARAYRGRRVRVRAFLRARQANAAALWVAVEGFAAGKAATLLSDSAVMLRGTTSWRETAIVFDVDPQAVCLRYGATLSGLGAAWLDAVSVDTVNARTAVTAPAGKPVLLGGDEPGQPNCSGMLPQPANLDFEEPPS